MFPSSDPMQICCRMKQTAFMTRLLEFICHCYILVTMNMKCTENFKAKLRLYERNKMQFYRNSIEYFSIQTLCSNEWLDHWTNKILSYLRSALLVAIFLLLILRLGS